MAIRKFLYMNGSEGFAQEQGSSDEISLGKISLLGKRRRNRRWQRTNF